MTSASGIRRLVLLGFAILVILVSVRGLHEPDEGRYTEIAREMLVSSDWLVPRLKGVPHYAKPPMTYWLIGGSMKLFGVNEFAARLPGLLAALASLLLVRALVLRIGGKDLHAWATALILLTTVEFFALAQIVTTDILLCTCVLAAMFARLVSLDDRRLRWQVLFWLAIATGFLVKGPIILMVVFTALLAAALVDRSSRYLRGLGWRWGVLLFSSVALPWFLAVVSTQEGLWDYFLGEELVARVQSGKGRAKPVWYFLAVFPLVTLPWSVFVPRALRDFRQAYPGISPLLVGWVVAPFVVFSLASSKLWTYMLPLVVPPAIFVGCAVGERSERWRKRVVLAGSVSLFLFASLVLVAEQHALKLGNNAGYRSFLKSLPADAYRGSPVTNLLDARKEPPQFEDGRGPALATYRFRCLAASFYVFGARPVFIPVYGKDSLWEIAAIRERDRPPALEDLAKALRDQPAMVVLTKVRYRKELEAACGRPLREVARAGHGGGAAIALSSR